MSKIKKWWKRLLGCIDIQFRWSSYEEWQEQYLQSEADDRGYAYPIVKAAWYASREIKKKEKL